MLSRREFLKNIGSIGIVAILGKFVPKTVPKKVEQENVPESDFLDHLQDIIHQIELRSYYGVPANHVFVMRPDDFEWYRENVLSFRLNSHWHDTLDDLDHNIIEQEAKRECQGIGSFGGFWNDDYDDFDPYPGLDMIINTGYIDQTMVLDVNK